DDRRAETLHDPRRDQHADRARQAAGERRHGEEGDADHEHAPAPEQVTRAPAEQQEAAERDRVCGDDPLKIFLRDVERGLDRRQRDVDDRDVEHGHEHRDADEREGQPAAGIRRVISRLHLSPSTRFSFRETYYCPSGSFSSGAGRNTFSTYEGIAALSPTSRPACSDRNQRCSSSSWKISAAARLPRSSEGTAAIAGSTTSLSQRPAAATSETGALPERSSHAL